MSRDRTRVVCVLPVLLAAVGCGYMGEPLAPLANIPARIGDISVMQRESQIRVEFAVPTVTTENFPVKPPPELDLRIGPGPDPFEEGIWVATARKVEPVSTKGGTAVYEIPASEWIGKEVIIAARAIGANGKTAGWSRLVQLPVVAPPQVPTDLRAENTARGIRLSWQAHGDSFRVYRRVGDGTERPLTGIAQSPWIDESTQFGQEYTYRVQTLVNVGENRTAESGLSAAITRKPIDEFPPGAPAGVRASVAPNSIELSWEPNPESDLASYRVYRVAPGGKLNKVADVDIPTYSDHDVDHGKSYRYEITALDQSGNESAHSAPSEVTFP